MQATWEISSTRLTSKEVEVYCHLCGDRGVSKTSDLMSSKNVERVVPAVPSCVSWRSHHDGCSPWNYWERLPFMHNARGHGQEVDLKSVMDTRSL